MWFIIQLLQQTKLHESHLIVYHDIYLAQILQQIDCFCLLVFFFIITWLGYFDYRYMERLWMGMF